MNPIDFGVDLTINQTYPIKTSIDPRWSFKEALGSQGANSTVYHVCLETNCNYIGKVIPIEPERDHPSCYTHHDLIRNELVISKHMSEIGVAPIIYDMALNDQGGVMIMNKYDGTLTDLLYLYQSTEQIHHAPSIPMENILQTVEQLLNKMHQNGVVHLDLYPDNILYTKSGLLAITDFGTSVYSNSDELRDYDKASLARIINVYNQIKNGKKFQSTFDVSTGTIPMQYYRLITLVNGQPCGLWK